MTNKEYVLVFPADDIEHEALLTSDWAAHVTRLHADSDLGFSQEYEVLITALLYYFSGVLKTVVPKNNRFCTKSHFYVMHNYRKSIGRLGLISPQYILPIPRTSTKIDTSTFYRVSKEEQIMMHS